MREYLLSEFKHYYTNQRKHSKDRLENMKNNYKLWNNSLKVLNYHVYSQISNVPKSNISNLAVICFKLQQTVEIWGFIGAWLIELLKLYDTTILNRIDKIIWNDWYIHFESVEKDLYIHDQECKLHLQKLDSMLKSLDTYFKHDRLMNTQNCLNDLLDLLSNLLEEFTNMIASRRIQLHGENGIVQLLTKVIRNIEDFIRFIQFNTENYVNNKNSKTYSPLGLNNQSKITTDELELHCKNLCQQYDYWMETINNILHCKWQIYDNELPSKQISRPHSIDETCTVAFDDSESRKFIGVYNQSIIRYLQSTDGTIREHLLANTIDGQSVQNNDDTEFMVQLSNHYLMNTKLAYLTLLKQNELTELLNKTEMTTMEFDKETTIVEQQWIHLCNTIESLQYQFDMKQNELKRLKDILQIKMEVLSE
ncbi:uncharacterized protein DC041_0005732 [Schistosoma bovis]|uniref:Uncharacterized protein n=1 Tax=Schistosoma bovis TaxID=6184 RepID=A0A430QD43_SCHBO|nr:uncharacterized protein DC041_0005732 [Schistosoma bovis]